MGDNVLCCADGHGCNRCAVPAEFGAAKRWRSCLQCVKMCCRTAWHSTCLAARPCDLIGSSSGLRRCASNPLPAASHLFLLMQEDVPGVLPGWGTWAGQQREPQWVTDAKRKAAQ